MASGNYPFTGNAQTFTNDFAVNNAYPGVEFGGTESGALYYEDRAVSGTKYFNVQNATFNKVAQSWLPIDITKPCYAMALTPTGAFQYLSVAAGVTPLSAWTIVGTFVPPLVNVKAAVPADGSASASVTLTFPNAIVAVLHSVGANYTGTDNAALTSRLAAVPTKSGFSIIVSGGQPNTTVDVHYQAFGS